MEPFKKQGGLKDSLGAYPSESLPAGVSWEELGPGIQDRLRGRRRRAMLWLVCLGCLLAGGLFLLPNQHYRVELVHAFPLLEAGGDLPGEVPSSSSPVMAPKRALLHGQNAEEVQGAVILDPPSRGTKSDSRSTRPTITIGTPEQEIQSIVETESSLELEAVDRETPSISTLVTYDCSISTENVHGLEHLTDSIRLPVDGRNPSDSIGRVVPRSRKWRKEMSDGLTQLFLPPGLGENTSPLGHRVSLTLGRTIGSTDWSVWYGVELAQYWRKEEVRDERDILIYQPNTVDTVYRNNFTGEERIVYTDTVPGRRTINLRLYQQLRSLSIPVMIRKSWSGEWAAAMQLGVDVNYNRWRAGEAVGPEGIPVATVTEDEWGMATRIGVQLYFPSARYGRFFVGAGYRAFLGDISGPAPATAYRPRSGNISVGLQW